MFRKAFPFFAFYDIIMKIEILRNKSKGEIDGIFQISLNKEGKCTYFKQWRFTR